MRMPTLTDLEIRHVLADMDLMGSREDIPGGWHLDVLQSAMAKLQQRTIDRTIETLPNKAKCA